MSETSYTPGELQQAGVARLLFGRAEDRIVGAVIDSRQASPGLAFVARRGEARDGHDFAIDAFERGCRVLLLQRDWCSTRSALLSEWQARGATVMMTREGNEALLTWARWRRGGLRRPKLLAITGSYGKTTSKQLIASCLGPYLRVSCSPGNWNSLEGVALSIIRIPLDAELALLECGIDHRGEMSEIAALLRPDQVLLTAVGAAHLQGLKDEETVAWEKSRLFQHVDDEGTVFLPADDPWYDYLRGQVRRGKVLPFGGKIAGWGGYADRGLDGGLLRLGNEELALPLHAYKERGIQAAVVVGRSWRLSDRQIVRGLREFSPVEGRGNLLRGRYTVLQDSYNAPKDSVVALLEWLKKREGEGRRYFVVLGDLLELGPESDAHHREIGRLCHEGAEVFYVFFGVGMRQAYSHCAVTSRDHTCWQQDYTQAALWLNERLRPGDVLVLKGARGMRLERILPLLEGKGG